MDSFIKNDVDILVQQLRNVVTDEGTMRIYGKPRTGRYYTGRTMQIYTTTSLYLAPERPTQSAPERTWAICISNVATMHRYRRMGAFTYYLKQLEKLADEFGGRVRVELVAPHFLQEYLRRRGYVIEPDPYLHVNNPTFWQPLKAKHA